MLTKILFVQIFYIIVMPNMDRRRRSSEGEENGPEWSLEEWMEEKRKLEEEKRKLEEEERMVRLDSQMSFAIDGASILEVQRYCYSNID